MGNLLSTSTSPPSAEQKGILRSDVKSPTPRSEPLYLDEVEAEAALWSEESICRTIQRFFGLLPDSPRSLKRTLVLVEKGEILKKEQQYPLFKQRSSAFVFDVGSRMGAITTIQRIYRQYRRLRIWHEVSDHMLQLARGRLAPSRAQEQDKLSTVSFRLLLADGFSASKVCISGALKTIQLRLVLDPEAGECYLTWTPSRKKKPRINLHDIEHVIAVQKDGNPEAPRLAKKVSHRRGIIIVCKSYHRGRVVLEVATKQERNIILQGFERLLNEMISNEPALDDVGALRNQHQRRQSVMEFFSPAEEPTDDSSDSSPSVIVTNLSPRRGSVAIYRPEPLRPLSEKTEEINARDSFAVSESARADAKAIEHYYHTRFDDSPDSAISHP